MRLFVHFSILVSLLFSISTAAYSDDTSYTELWKYPRTITPEGYVCARTSGPLTLDGRLDEPSWKAAPWTNSFVDLMGASKPAPRFKTHVKMLWDDTYFYVGAYLEEPHVWGTMLFHDQVMFFENDFEVFIDPNSDSREYYEFEISPLAALWDLYLPGPYKDMGMDGLNVDHLWDLTGTIVKVWVDGTLNNPRDLDRGWSVELAFPWSELAWKAHRPCPPLDGDTWRMNFYRAQYPPEIITSDRTTSDIQKNAYNRREEPVPGKMPDQWVWSPQGVNDIHRPETWGFVQFSTEVPGKAEYRPDPLLEGKRILHDIYYAQRDFQKKNKRWAKKLSELGLDYTGNPAIKGKPAIKTTKKGYTAYVTAILPDGKTRKIFIRQNALVGVEK